MTTRREVLRAGGGALTIALGGLQIACSPEEAARIDAAALSDSQLLTLVAMLQHLFPHENLDLAVYRDAVLVVADSLQTNPDRHAIVRSGIESLNREASWLELPSDQQIAALVAIEGSPFLNTVRNAALGRVYSDERTWQMLGYGGDASKYGGYIDRGFNDIDWLPDSDTREAD